MTTRSNTWSSISAAAFLAFCLIVGALLVYEHRIHILGFLPFAFFSTCILMYLFMHNGDHQHHIPWRGEQGRDA